MPSYPCGNNIKHFLKDIGLPELAEEQGLNSDIYYLELETAFL